MALQYSLQNKKVDVWKIQGLLRHSTRSEVVLGYIREAHIKASTDVVEAAALARDLSAIRTELCLLY